MALLEYLVILPIGTYLIFNSLYLFVSAAAGWFGGKDDASTTRLPVRIRRIAVLVPAYKEDKVILDSVQANLQQTYPSDSYDIYVIADSFRPETLQQLSHFRVNVLVVSFEQSTVQKSLTKALELLPQGVYDIVLVSDADNHMAPDFLHRVNLAFDSGWRAVQGHRVAKNTNTSVAVFDAMNEEVNNHLFRKGQRALGFSASLIGSGMAFEPDTMKRAMGQIRSVGGYDKELEMLLLTEGIRIAYLNDALIYDEKVQNLEVFEHQRARWIAAQIHFVKLYFGTGIRQLLRGNLHAFNGLVKGFLIPRILYLALLSFGTFLGLVLGLQPVFQFFGLLLAMLIFTLLTSTPGYLWKKISIRDLLTLPVLIFRMIRSLLKVKTASKKFMHTPHGETVVKEN
ncbi:cellulose synthase/poly-beta-1,6-N-acetylglucosamine synthase-like glycosyltransferase [Larkinella arboricola]|uniref:Cellulose synthase/poly-beta-1,6-N-acetylglucosamine synthase-like glycosyltransferase n=1 Tax=Larkinella arboricola TaxID=643671 RepID=A0A327WQV3_LARAB|nr:glycosyltransferase family 2 protein [Larkinella arboricola]RAJ93993.1 cellulose synthase/poly-beta-1,6-N-acetylglucosamine synthase-like glycosyltransferase [Larkinella arboricola]